jgi:type II secretory pathway pseudopilin PulG
MPPFLKRARFVSMLEMILVIALLATVGSAASYLTFSASKKEEFQAAAGAVMDRLKFAEELMMLGSDLSVTFKQDGKHFFVELKTDRDLDGTTKKLLSIPSPITGIDTVLFNGQDARGLKLDYGSFGMIMPQGEITLKGRYGETTFPIKPRGSQDKLSQDLYPYEVLQKAS